MMRFVISNPDLTNNGDAKRSKSTPELGSRYRRLLVASVSAWALFLSPDVQAWQTNENSGTSGRLLFSHESVSQADSQIFGALEFRLAKGWHLYWKNARSVGLAPKVRLDSTHSKLLAFLFPFPETVVSPQKPDDFSYGYLRAVRFPFIVERSEQSTALQGIVHIDYLVCNIQCIPESFEFPFLIPEETESRKTPAFKSLEEQIQSLSRSLAPDQWKQEWLSDRSLRLDFPQLKVSRLAVAGAPPVEGANRKNLKVHVTKESAHQWLIRHDNEPQRLEWMIETERPSKNEAPLLFSGLSEIPASFTTTNATTPSSIPSANADTSSLWLILFFAFLGGFILNLMPCVLPVVFMKTTSVLKLREKKRDIKSSLLATIAGIITSFLVLATVITALRASGELIGWGFQFQSPLFLFFLLSVLIIFALNLWGVFDVSLSSSSATFLSRFQGPFAEGVLATLLATPCSAPFLGTALSFALAQPAPQLFLIFFVMSLGLSLPYIFLILAPSALSALPRPGPWMEGLKRILAYSLAASALWLFSVFAQLVSHEAMMLALMALSLMALLLKELPLRWALVLSAIVLVFASLEIRHLQSTDPQNSSSSEVSTTVADLESRLTKGDRLFVVVTADWCLTCKVNEEAVIHTEWFSKELEQRDIQLYILDWTRPNSEITVFLKEHNRIAIPFSALMSAEKTELLPELLTKNAVMRALERF